MRTIIFSLDRRLILVASYMQPWRVGGIDAFLPSNTGLIESSLDYSVQKKKCIGIALSYQRDEDPNGNFLDEEFPALDLKIKVGS